MRNLICLSSSVCDSVVLNTLNEDECELKRCFTLFDWMTPFNTLLIILLADDAFLFSSNDFKVEISLKGGGNGGSPLLFRDDEGERGIFNPIETALL